MRSGQLSYMHRPRFAYACRRRRHSLGPETRNPNAHYCTLSARNDRRPTHVFKMLADSIVIANGSSEKARVAFRILLSESAVQHLNENAYRLRACRTQELAIYVRDMPFKATRAGRARKRQTHERNSRREQSKAQSTFFATAIAASLECLQILQASVVAMLRRRRADTLSLRMHRMP